MKKLFILISIIFLLVIGWYLISPAFVVVEVNDVSPLIETNSKMDPAMQESFDKEMEKMKDEVLEMDEKVVLESEIIAQGDFIPEDHEVKGKAVLISIDQQKTLRFEDFETINGPNLHIYLSEDLEANNYIDLGKIKATKGNVNYNVDSSVDLEKYDKVLVWCVPFKVLFSYAELS